MRLVLSVLGFVYEVEQQGDVLETVQETDVHKLSQVNEQVLGLDQLTLVKKLLHLLQHLLSEKHLFYDGVGKARLLQLD